MTGLPLASESQVDEKTIEKYEVECSCDWTLADWISKTLIGWQWLNIDQKHIINILCAIDSGMEITRCVVQPTENSF